MTSVTGSQVSRRFGLRPFPGRVDGGTFTAGVIAWTAVAFILVLLGFILWMSFLPGLPGDPGGFTLQNYVDVFDRGTIFIALWNSLLVGFGTVLVNLLFAVPIAWLIERTDIPGKPLIVTLIAISILIPGFLKAMAWILLLSPEIGMINRFAIDILGAPAAPLNIYGLGGVILVQGLALMPAMFFLITGSMRALDPTLEEAAQMSGASRVKTILRISAPLVWPAILAALIYNMITAVSLYEVAALLLGSNEPVLSTELFLNVRSAGGTISLAYAAVYAVLMMLLSLGALWFYARTIQRGERFAVVTGKGYRPAQVELGRWKWVGIAFIGLFLLGAEILPLLTLLWMSLLPSLVLPSVAALERVAFDQYARAWDLLGGWDVVGNTLILVVATPLLAVVVSLAISIVTIRSELPARRFLDGVAMLPHVIPGIAFAFALIVVGILLNRWLSIPLYGSVAIVLLAMLVERIPYCTRITNAALLQLHKEIEEAGSMCGARRFQIVRRIVVPLIAPSIGYASLWIGLLSLREVTIPLLLSGPDNTVLAVRIWTLWETGQYSAAAAIGVSMFVIMAAVLLTAQYGLRAVGQSRR